MTLTFFQEKPFSVDQNGRVKAQLTRYCERTMIMTIVSPDMTHDSPAGAVASLKRLSPIRLIVGTMESGVMNLKSKPMIPVNPRKTSTQELTMMAPWISRILLCHTSVYSSSDTRDKCLNVEFLSLPAMTWKSVGQLHEGRERMARVGTRKVKVAPWMTGSLIPKVVWRKEATPEQKSVVAMMYPLAGSVSLIHSLEVRM